MSRKTAVITGASGGIGMELASMFAAHGYDLVLVARGIDSLQKLADELHQKFDIAANVIRMDMAQPAAGGVLWKAISAIAPEVDVLVNNAGIGDSGDFASEAPEAIERMIHLNIASLTSLTRHVLPGMIARKHGKILNVASLAGFQPGGPGMAVYYASKSYVLSFSRAIRSELRGSGVTVTALCPGPTRTGFEAAAGAQQIRLFHWPKPMEAREVAVEGFGGMQRGSAVVVPGLLNKLLAFSPRLVPSCLALGINRFLLAKRE